MTSHPAMVALLVATGLAYAHACCTANQWECYMGGSVFKYHAFYPAPKVYGILSRISYDAKKKMMASATETKKGVVRNILDFPQKKYYLIAGKDCWFFKLDQPFRKACTGDGTPFPLRMGVGNHSLGLVSYLKQTKHYTHTVAVTQPDCAPASESYMARTGLLSYLSCNAGYFNVTLGIKKPSVFVPPKGCVGGRQIDEIYSLTGLNSTRMDFLGIDLYHV